MITQSILALNLNYYPFTGLFIWNRQLGRVKKGDLAGTVNSNGYVQIRIRGKIYLAHRLAWLYVHGEFPNTMLDHINMDKKDNRIANLRLATKSQNSQNTLKSAANTSGYKGVSWYDRSKKWRASIKLNQKFKHLGLFESKEDAYEAYKKAAKELHTCNNCN
jgi:hypothetical protein